MARAVLIDDEERLLATLARFLERHGLEVCRAKSFAEAQEHLYPGRFEVLITDIVMPDYDGLRVLHEVVNQRGCQESHPMPVRRLNTSAAARKAETVGRGSA